MRIGLVGYYGFGNYGDELFRAVFEHFLTDCTFEVLEVERLENDAECRQKFESSVDAVIIGGGDLVIPSAWAEVYFSDILLRKPVFLYGVGVPTWMGINPEVVEKLERFFRHPSICFIATRDRESADWIRLHLSPDVVVHDYPDIVCALPLPHIDKPKPNKVFTVISRLQKPGEIPWDNIRALCDRAVRYDYVVRNLILASGSSAEEDLRIVRTEAADMNWEIVQKKSFAEMTRSIGESTAVASMKFHGCVVAALFGIPAIGLSTTNKFLNFFKSIERIDLQGHYRHTDLAERLPRHLVQVPKATVHQLRSNSEWGLHTLAVALRTRVLEG